MDNYPTNAPFPYLQSVPRNLTNDTPDQSIPCSALTKRSKSVQRSKIWQLKEANHCPIIGTCLSMDELIRFARRFHFEASLDDTFRLHVEMVDRMATRNNVSEAIQKHLDTRYQLYLSRFETVKMDGEVLNLWKKYFNKGEIAGPLWAAFTHKRITDETRGKIYGDIHMHAHQMGAGQAADARRLAQLEKDCAEMKAVLTQQKSKHVQIETKLRERLRKAMAEIQHLRQAEKEFAKCQARLTTIESGKTMIDMGQRLMKLTVMNEQLQETVKQFDHIKQSLQVACNKIASLMQTRDALVEECDALKARLLADHTHSVSAVPLPSDEQAKQQYGCIICVGGRIDLFPQYRLIAEQLGILLLQHDGGRQDALSRLSEMVNRADAALCPTDCVGHAAYYQLKRLCKRSGKPCLLYKGKGVSSFAAALTQLATGKTSFSSTINGSLLETAE
ncbi:MAG TPA: hypothetical protein DEO56_01050 [Nitrosomonas nitrosa]|nr:hypothetical protein [Nitrosomonas nitrosa]